MLPWLSQSSGSGTGNGIGSQAPIYYCSMLVLSCTLFFTRLYNHAHIHLDPRHDVTSLLRPISPLKFSPQHSLPQRRVVVKAATKAAAVAIPVLSTTIQAAPAIIPDLPLNINPTTHSSSSSSSSPSSSASTSTLTSTKKPTKSTHVASPTPSPAESPSPEIPSPQATGTPGLNDSPPPSAEISRAPSQARVGAGASPSDASSHHNPLVAVSGPLGDSSPSGPGPQSGMLPNNDPNKTSPSTARNSMSPTAMMSASLGCIAAVAVLVVGALVVRRRVRNRRQSQVEMDFEGLGAYPSGATAGGGGGGLRKGKGTKRQQKTEYHVGLTSFGSFSSAGGRAMSVTGIKKPVPLAQPEQFWNP